MALGASIATAIAGVLRNQFGTKLTVVIIGIPTTIGWLLLIFAEYPWMVRNSNLCASQVEFEINVVP